MADFDFILEKLKTKSSTKQLIYKTTCDVFTELKHQLQEIQKELNAEMERFDKNVEIKYSSHGNFEVHLKFSGDTLVFMMHTNVFNFDDNQYIHRTDYVKEDPMRSYCGLIQIYNFLSDSIKYNRLSDVGYLIGRLYINKEQHFFIEGKRPLSLHYHNFETQVIDAGKIKEIIEQAIIYCLDFDLLTPPFDAVNFITIEQKNMDTYSSGVPTGKRLGFQFFTDARKQLE